MYDSIKDRVRDNQRIETVIVIVGSYGNQVSYLLSMNILQDDTLIDGVVEAISFNLINGEKVTIDDVIIPKKEIGNIIKENIRESVLNVFRLKQQKYNKIYTLDDLENEIANIVNQYENNELQIAVSPNTMYITNGISEYYYEISLENIYKNVIIYNRYNTTKSLYDGTYIRKGPYFVFEEADGNIPGYCFCIVEVTEGGGNLRPMKTLYIDDLCVDENRRGEHIGTQLYEYVKHWAAAQGFYRITLNVWELNGPAASFYRHLGLKPLKTTMEELLS